jgi:glycosyltransferase involved in cell wall biosynthesis
MTRLLLVAQPPDGGVYRHIATVAPLLVARGFEVTVAGPAPYAAVGPGVEHVEIDLVRGISPRDDLAGAARLARVIRSVRPALIHAHSSKAGALVRALRLLAPRVPVVYTAHGFAFAGHFESERQRRLYRLIEAGLSPLTTRTLCVCEFERDLAASVGRRSRTRVVHNGVAAPPRVPDPRAADLAGRGPVVGAVAGLRPGKGIETLIAATPGILRGAPGAQIVVGGGGPLAEPLRRQAEELGVADRVHLIGELDDAGALLSATTVAVHPSWPSRSRTRSSRRWPPGCRRSRPRSGASRRRSTTA